MATDEGRRQVLAAGAAGAVTLLSEQLAAATPQLEPIPRAQAVRTPGRPGDFDFLTGEWRIQNWRRRDTGAWEEFPGEATVTRILNGIGSVEELRIPARDFSGMGLRLLDVQQGIWSDFWVNARSGVLTTPGQTGSFESGAGIFVAHDTENGQPVQYAGIWDRITREGCRWRQAASRDGGSTWEQNWIMHWTRQN